MLHNVGEISRFFFSCNKLGKGFVVVLARVCVFV